MTHASTTVIIQVTGTPGEVVRELRSIKAKQLAQDYTDTGNAHSIFGKDGRPVGTIETRPVRLEDREKPMPEFAITFTRTAVYRVIVEADGEEEAFEEAQADWGDDNEIDAYTMLVTVEELG